MVYALGRRLEAEDMPTVRRIVREAARDDYRFGAIVLGIVRSAQFQQKARFTTSAAQTVADNRSVRCLDRRVEVMFITKKHLSRRTVLRGALGAAIGLPLLDAMVPAASAAPPAQLQVRRRLRAERSSAGDLDARVGRQARAAAAVRAVRAATRAHQPRDGAPRPGPVRTPRDRVPLAERRVRETDAERGRAGGSNDRSAHRRRNRARHAAALARARDRGHQQRVELVPVRLELPLSEHVGLANGDHAVCRTR